MNIFSFCIYGKDKKYCQGLIKNIEIINEFYPRFKIYVAVGNNVPEEYIDKYKKYTNVILNFHPLMEIY